MTKPTSTEIPPGRKPCPKCKAQGHVKDKAWTGGGVRQKGQRGEREVVKLLQPIVDKVCLHYGLEPIVLQRNALQAHLGGEDIHGLEGFSIEVKFCENEQLNQWWSQAVRQAKARAAVPVLFYRCAGSPWRVKLRAYVNTPGDSDQHQMDVLITPEEFLTWFEDAFSEPFRKGLTAGKESSVQTANGWEVPPEHVKVFFPCTCVPHPGSHCKHCHH